MESVVLGAIIRQKQGQRDELQRDVDAFLAKGGKIQQLRNGEMSGVAAYESPITRANRAKKEKQS